MKKGEVTAFLSLIFILLLSVVVSIVESASIQAMKNQRRGDMDRALESVFAEYQKNMLQEYEIFTLDGTYGTGEYDENNITERLEFYGMRETLHNIEGIQFLTDDSGRPFREQVIAYMKQKMGVSQVEELAGLGGEWEEQTGESGRYEQEERKVEHELEESLQEEEQTLPHEENPIETISSIKASGILNVVVKNNINLSNKSVPLGEMLTHRSLRKGKGEYKIREDTADKLSNLYFTSYLIEKFSAADAPYEEGRLSYELEYILNGGGSDRENLEAVVKKLAAIRFAANYGYILTDGEKKAEAGAMALTMAGIIALPALTEIIKQAILLAWAFGESLMDVRALLSGKKVSLVKNREEWQLSLSGLLKLGTEEDRSDGRDSENGLSYRDYIKMLLLFEKQEDCTMRSLSLIEMRMQKMCGEFFKADNCISKLKIRTTCDIRRNIRYEFLASYGYQ